MIETILYISIGFICGLALAGLRLLSVERKNATLTAQITAEKEARHAMDDHFKLSAQEAVRSAHESFLQLAEARFKDAQKDQSHDMEKRHKAIDEMVGPVKEKLKELSGSLDQMKGTDQALREDLQNLNRETSKLAGALRNPAARGNWGEEMLERLLETSGLIKGVHYSLQTTLKDDDRRLRPDAIITLPDSLHIVIDAKAPISDFVRDLDSDMDERSYKSLQTGLAQAVKGHIQDLGKKAYWEQLNSPDFVVLFLPSEHLFSAAVQADPTLLELAAERKVILASPILMMSLLRVVGMSWRQVELAKNAQEISERGHDLYKRFLTFTDKIEKIGKGLQSAMRGYDETIGSLERSVLPAARKFKDLQGGVQLDSVPEIKVIEETPRALNLNSDDETEKRRA